VVCGVLWWCVVCGVFPVLGETATAVDLLEIPLWISEQRGLQENIQVDV
jgi:hypothetical protein